MLRIFPLFILLKLSHAVLLRDPVVYQTKENLLKAEPYKWSEEYYSNMPIDHFSFTTNKSFSLRYLINTEYFKPQGPIFFYTGNEGDVEGFAKNTGFMWDIAPEYGAAIVFAEHRFYGKTQPFGKESYKTVSNLGYLSSEQALADFVELINHLKNKRIQNAKKSPVIAFGGSYGGMLAAWIRIKYPHIVDGAIAASAPVFWFRNANVPQDVYDRIVMRSFVNSGCNMKNVMAGWKSIQNLAKSGDGLNWLNKRFRIEEKSKLEKPEEAIALIGFVKEAMESMAMVNYPYPADFLSPLPGWPVQETCKFFNKTSLSSDKEAAEQVYSLLNLYYNYTGKTETLCVKSDICSGAYAALGDPLGWPWQACTEMVMPLCSSGPPNDFFPKDCPFTIGNFSQYCTKTFNFTGYTPNLMRPDWVIENYGAKFPTATNIVFSNGYLDPWSGGGFRLYPITEGTLVSLIIEDGAHHYDLRGAHPADTEAVKEARRLEMLHISRWIREANQDRKIKAEKKKIKAARHA